VKLLGHLPFLVGAEPKEVLIVGFGIGVTTSTILMHKEVESVECIELAEELKYAAKFYTKFNNNVVNDKRLKIIGNDGRHYLQSTTKKYDLISSDPTHPVLGSGALYSKEYFQLCYDHLTDDGIVSQYLPMHKLRIQDHAGIIKTFKSIFNHSTVWIGHTHTILFGTKKPLKINFAEWERKALKINDPMFLSDPYSLASYFMLGENGIEQIAKDTQICSDNDSYLDFFAFECFRPENWSINAKNILSAAFQDKSIFYNVTNEELLEKYIMSNKLILEGLIASMSGDRNGYIRKLQEAYRVNPENQEVPFLLKLEGMKR
ncbi:MAG: hypothetical protein KAH33_06655, partial [Candidatus Delongbacteria bacterium]|nr:hypothetical protein [Candidatus Delongbacteria bacterium]